MISVLIETTLHSLTNVTILVDLPTFPRNVIERELTPLLLFCSPPPGASQRSISTSCSRSKH
jgi:hypothetical protein